jgi:hypothetical protein
MAGEFEKLFGPKVTKDKPKWPSGVGVGLIPNSIHPCYRADRLHLVLAQLRGVP